MAASLQAFPGRSSGCVPGAAMPQDLLLLTPAVAAARRWCVAVRQGLARAEFLLLLAATATAAVPGISAAGSTPASRRRTAAADAELLLLGPGQPRPHGLPPLPAGVSPALISHVVLQRLQLPCRVVAAGLEVLPAVPHRQVPHCRPAMCLSTGRALPHPCVARLLAWGEEQGRRWRQQRPGALLVLGECVVGGTSTAAAVLQGLGIDAAGLVSGSLRDPPHRLREELISQGLAAAGATAAAPLSVVAAVGDPMQVVAAGVVLGVGGAAPLLLAGGSQMAAVLALVVAVALQRGWDLRPLLAATALGTTRWVASEPGSNLGLLLERIGSHYQLPQPLLACATTLNFASCSQQALRDFEDGFVKEGVGAGGLAVVATLAGVPPARLAVLCDRGMEQLLCEPDC